MTSRSGKSKAPYITYDTSIYYELLKDTYADFKKEIDRLGTAKRFGLYFSIIELNLGLLQSWVSYYKDVENLRDPSRALAVASDKRGRGSKYILTLESLNKRFNEVTPNKDVDAYLTQLEATIYKTVVIIGGSVTEFIGSFGDHVLAQLRLDSRDDYASFMADCSDHAIVDIASFIRAKEAEVRKIKSHVEKLFETRDNQSMRDINELLDKALNDPAVCNLVKMNRKYGDIVIALDHPKTQLLVSTDHSFEILSEGLAKPHKKLARGSTAVSATT